MGKTTLACATAVGLAAQGRRVLLVSTDPASNLDEVLETALGEEPRAVAGIPGLDAANVDPEAAAHEYRERLVAPYRGVLPDAALRSMEESLSGACTVEIAAFDAFTRLLADAEATRAYDNLIFDTAPTGHTLRLLSLPAAWTEFIDQNTTGTSCLGPLAGLERQRALYAESVAILTDPARTTLVLVARPEPSALAEAARTAVELSRRGDGAADPGAERRLHPDRPERPGGGEHGPAADRCALADPRGAGVAGPRRGPLLGFAPLGAAALARVLGPGRPSAIPDEPSLPPVADAPLTELIDELEPADPASS